MPKVVFISATGTEVGKTFALCELLHLYPNSTAIKPIITGLDQKNYHNSDSAKILNALNQEINWQNILSISPFYYQTPAAPNIAALQENKDQIDYNNLREFCLNFIKENQDKDYIFIEGAGGLFVPINSDKTIYDLIRDINSELLIVASNYLGTISHSLSCLKYLEQNFKNEIKFYLNPYPDNNSYLFNFNSICKFTKIKCFNRLNLLFA